ncbi:MAG: exopolysaccharide biosynthesis polyprenyl glycosylphosphotransferase [Lachnospiraceae bacterium]|nr:exopolysaccharide biosynthesis polyprenyl glycosylphosphotransferase [Lachnospiraceae bacterium]
MGDVILKDNKNIKKLRRTESFKRLINLGLSAICLGLEVGMFAYMWIFHFQNSVVEGLRNFWFKGHLLEIAIYGVMLFLLSVMYGGMRLGYLKNVEIIFSQIFATILANIFIYGELSVMAFQLFMPKLFIYMTIVQIIIVIVWISIANLIYKNVFPPRKLAVIHNGRSSINLNEKFELRKDKYKVVENIPYSMDTAEICEKISRDYENGVYNAVVLGDMPVAKRNILFKYCYEKMIRVYLLPKISDVILTGAEELHVFDTPLLLTREYKLSMEERFIKRMIDIVFSLILLIVASPFMLLTALAIKLYDRGPILYKQVRCTEGRREFMILKFRSMRTDAEKDGVARLASKTDDRITPVGKFIRKCRLDELPQLINILKGDMSFIGPRPERPEIIAQYVEVMPEFVYRMNVKAGLAGFAQVYGKYNTTPYDKLKLDLTYIENYSVMMDLKLMLLTLKILFWPDSTEGVETEQLTALREVNEARKKEYGEDDIED